MFVKIIEEMLIGYYQSIVQHIKKWEKPVPKIANKEPKKGPVNTPAAPDRWTGWYAQD